MIRVFTSTGCLRTPGLAHALEEVGASWEPVLVDEASFTAAHGRPGPLFEDGGLRLFEVGAALRHLMRTSGKADLAPKDAREAATLDERLDDYAVNVAPATQVLATSLRDGGASSNDKRSAATDLATTLAPLAGSLGERDFLLDRFTLADCAFSPLQRLAMLGRSSIVAPTSTILAYARRVAARPAHARALARLQPPTV